MNELSTDVKSKSIQIIDETSVFSAKNFNHYLEVATHLSKSTMIPKGYSGKPMDILVAIDMGNALGLPMMQAIQDIAVINGKPCMYGDGLLAVVQGHPQYEWIVEEPVLEKAEIVGYKCTVKRKNHPEHTTVFTREDAKKASLWGKQGPWSQYPARMMQMRARGYALRDIFADALRGIKPVEEVKDYKEIIDVTEQSRPSAKSVMVELMNDSASNGTGTVTNDGTKSRTSQESLKEKEPTRLELVDEVLELIVATNFSEDRIEKAFNHYEVNAVEEMDRVKLLHFINVLDKELVKKAEELNAIEIDPETGEVIQ